MLSLSSGGLASSDSQVSQDDSQPEATLQLLREAVQAHQSALKAYVFFITWLAVQSRQVGWLPQWCTTRPNILMSLSQADPSWLLATGGKAVSCCGSAGPCSEQARQEGSCQAISSMGLGQPERALHACAGSCGRHGPGPPVLPQPA